MSAEEGELKPVEKAALRRFIYRISGADADVSLLEATETAIQRIERLEKQAQTAESIARDAAAQQNATENQDDD